MKLLLESTEFLYVHAHGLTGSTSHAYQGTVTWLRPLILQTAGTDFSKLEMSHGGWRTTGERLILRPVVSYPKHYAAWFQGQKHLAELTWQGNTTSEEWGWHVLKNTRCDSGFYFKKSLSTTLGIILEQSIRSVKILQCLWKHLLFQMCYWSSLLSP